MVGEFTRINWANLISPIIPIRKEWRFNRKSTAVFGVVPRIASLCTLPNPDNMLVMEYIMFYRVSRLQRRNRRLPFYLVNSISIWDLNIPPRYWTSSESCIFSPRFYRSPCLSSSTILLYATIVNLIELMFSPSA